MAKARNVASAAFTDPLRPRGRDADDLDAGGAAAGDAEPLDAAIERVLAELGGDADASINIYAIRPGARSGEFVDSFPADHFAGEASFLKRIRDEFGPGEYRIQLRDGTKFLVNRLVRIAPARERPRGGELDAAGVVAALSSVLESHTKRTEDLVRSALAARAPDSEDQILARLKAMREVFGPIGGAPARSGADSIEVFLRGLTLGRSLEPTNGADTSDVLLETVRTLGPALVRAVEQGNKRIAGPKARGAASPGARVAPDDAPASARANRGTPGEDAVSPGVRKLLEQLVEAAARDADPDLYAELTLDQVGADAVQKLFAAGDPVILLGNLEPRVLEHREWFAALQASLQAMLADETPNPLDAADTGLGGRDADAASHAGNDA